MKRHVLLFFTLTACQQQIDLGVTPRDAIDTEAQDQPVSTNGEPGPSSSTGNTGPTGATGNTGGHGWYRNPVVGAWVRQVGNAGVYDRMSFGADNTWISTTDSVSTAHTVSFYWQGPMHLDWVSGGATMKHEERLVFAYYWRDERYPFLAWGAYERATAAPGVLGTWDKVWVESSPSETNTWTSSFEFRADGTVTTTLKVVGPASTNITLIPGNGTYTCPEVDRCVLDFGIDTREVHLTNGKLVDVDNDRWQRAKACATGEPTPWPNPQGCLPVFTICSLGQSAEWNGCNWSCVAPNACEDARVDTCVFDQDCANGETCEHGLEFTVPGGQAQGLCVKARTFCTVGGPNVCATGHSCVELCPANTSCQAQCLIDR